MTYFINTISSMISFFGDIKRVSISQWDVEHKDYSITPKTYESQGK